MKLPQKAKSFGSSHWMQLLAGRRGQDWGSTKLRGLVHSDDAYNSRYTLRSVEMEERFYVSQHDQLPGKTMVEYWREGKFIAGIYPHQDGLRVVSKYLVGVDKDPSYPPAAVIKLEVD